MYQNYIFYVIRQGLCHGLKNLLMVVSGILTGIIVYLTLVVVGLSSIGKNIYFQIIVRFLGGIYLLRFSMIIFKEKVHLNLVCKTSKNVYKEALLINLSNPKAMILGLHISESEGANFWLQVLTNLSNRGVKYILIESVDDLKGFSKTVNSVFPKTEIQLCIIH